MAALVALSVGGFGFFIWYVEFVGPVFEGNLPGDSSDNPIVIPILVGGLLLAAGGLAWRSVDQFGSERVDDLALGCTAFVLGVVVLLTRNIAITIDEPVVVAMFLPPLGLAAIASFGLALARDPKSGAKVPVARPKPDLAVVRARLLVFVVVSVVAWGLLGGITAHDWTPGLGLNEPWRHSAAIHLPTLFAVGTWAAWGAARASWIAGRPFVRALACSQVFVVATWIAWAPPVPSDSLGFVVFLIFLGLHVAWFQAWYFGPLGLRPMLSDWRVRLARRLARSRAPPPRSRKGLEESGGPIVHGNA